MVQESPPRATPPDCFHCTFFSPWVVVAEGGLYQQLNLDGLAVVLGKPGLQFIDLGSSVRVHLFAFLEEPEVGHSSHSPFPHQSLHHPRSEKKIEKIKHVLPSYIPHLECSSQVHLTGTGPLMCNVITDTRLTSPGGGARSAKTYPRIGIRIAVDLHEDSIRVGEAHLNQLRKNHFTRSTCSSRDVNNNL